MASLVLIDSSQLSSDSPHLGIYSSPMASLVLIDSSQLSSDSPHLDIGSSGPVRVPSSWVVMECQIISGNTPAPPTDTGGETKQITTRFLSLAALVGVLLPVRVVTLMCWGLGRLNVEKVYPHLRGGAARARTSRKIPRSRAAGTGRRLSGPSLERCGRGVLVQFATVGRRRPRLGYPSGPEGMRGGPLSKPFKNAQRTHTRMKEFTNFKHYSFSMYTPSIIASSSIAAALHGLDWTTKSSCSLNQLLDLLHRITAIEKDFLQSCLQKIEDMVTRTMSSRSGEGGEGCTSSGNGGGSSGTNSRNNLDQAAANEKVMEHGKAGTPTDVRDVHF
uniref:Cyclin C-terminal domain-containing protein n=1 Tax=Timema shepardi TaxID=629360 RepID=A0A7R9AME3_TIMSH|nr:unnamed protein product [Timema shepardi]